MKRLLGGTNMTSEKGRLSVFVSFPFMCWLNTSAIVGQQVDAWNIPSWKTMKWESTAHHCISRAAQTFFCTKTQELIFLFFHLFTDTQVLLLETGFSPGLCDPCTVNIFSLIFLSNLWDCLKAVPSFITILLCFVCSLN